MNSVSRALPILKLAIHPFILAILAIFLQTGFAEEFALFPCPDCGKQISRRAVSCPGCGCPRVAIQEAVRADDEAKRPKHIVSAIADGRKGIAVLVTHEDIRYLIIDAFLLAGRSSLNFSELGTDNSIGYSEPELMSDSPLLRFKVIGQPHATALELSSASGPEDPSGFLSSEDLQFKTDATSQMVAALGNRGELLAVRVGLSWMPVRAGMKWAAVKPADLRAQLDLITRSQESFEKGKLSDQETASLRETKWLTPYLESRSAKLLQTSHP